MVVRRALIVAAVAVLLVAVPAEAGPPQPFRQDPSRTQGWRAYWLDTQGGWPTGDPSTWVHNPTPCPWADQDRIVNVGSGFIDVGAAGVVSNCLIADYDGSGGPSEFNYPKQVAVWVVAPTASLTLTLTNDLGGSWTVPPPVPYGNDWWQWMTCVDDPVAYAPQGDLSGYPEVPGSNGGRGLQVNYTLLVVSPDQRTRNVSAYLEAHGSGDPSSSPRELQQVPCP